MQKYPGSVPNLRGLQLLRNPLLYPPKNVLEKGSTAVIQFLQKEWKEYEVCSENDSFNTLKSLQRISSKETLPPENVNNAEKLECSKTNYNPLTRKQESHNLKDCVKITKLVRPKLKTTMAIFKDFITEADENNQQLPLVEIIEQASENAKATSPSTMDGDENVSSHKEIKLENSPRLMVKSKLIKDIWLKKISTVLEEQQSELQRRRSKDALDKWQHDAKELQIKKWMEYLKGEASSQMPQLEMPYGVDEEHKRMISRSEIGKQEKSSNSKRRFSRSTENNCEMVTSKISAILDVLQELRKTRSARAVTPRSEKKNLSFEIKKINELQRTVMSLKEKNINLI
ncbi:uncharacterized protein LOC142330892 isoform X2 [Lycorma delicatula]|uniref:uncharacterized protein LOC142330892 isoform X2 n=1 Tax=Lycorma delicatula TaxID=130591 RepID=UPI003F511CB5